MVAPPHSLDVHGARTSLRRKNAWPPSSLINSRMRVMEASRPRLEPPRTKAVAGAQSLRLVDVSQVKRISESTASRSYSMAMAGPPVTEELVTRALAGLGSG